MGQYTAKHGVHSNMLYRGLDQALAGLPSLFSDQGTQELAEKEAEWQKEREALYAEIGRLTTRLSWLGKNYVHCVGREERRRLIDWENRELPASSQAELLTLNRSCLYYQPVPPPAKEVAFKHRIDEIYTAHPYYGYRRIASKLHREGQSINQKTVACSMQEMGLSAVYPGSGTLANEHT